MCWVCAERFPAKTPNLLHLCACACTHVCTNKGVRAPASVSMCHASKLHTHACTRLRGGMRVPLLHLVARHMPAGLPHTVGAPAQRALMGCCPRKACTPCACLRRHAAASKRCRCTMRLAGYGSPSRTSWTWPPSMTRSPSCKCWPPHMGAVIGFICASKFDGVMLHDEVTILYVLATTHGCCYRAHLCIKI